MNGVLFRYSPRLGHHHALHFEESPFPGINAAVREWRAGHRAKDHIYIIIFSLLFTASLRHTIKIEKM